MKRALSDPASGYYTQNARIGFSGADFFTAPEISSAFASLLALQIQELDTALSFPDPFYLMEAGPGNGTLMEGLLTIFMKADPGLFKRIAPVLFELPGILEEEQRRRLSRFSLSNPPRWLRTGPESPDIEPFIPGSGVVFGNEFLDALPVHRLRVCEGRWEEAYVEFSGNACLETWGPLSVPELSSALAEIFPGDMSQLEGRETEVCLDAPKTLDFFDRCLSRGFMLWIDYGDIRSERHSERRKKGTLMAYKEQKVTENLFEKKLGDSDLTAFVDFSQISAHLFALGYRLEGYTDQMSWLMGLGFSEWLSSNEERLSPEEIQAASVLLHPLKMGRIFKVLMMSKGMAEPFRSLGFRFGGLRSPLEGR
jgi:SAM-dependent MidA family methyltransferase